MNADRLAAYLVTGQAYRPERAGSGEGQAALRSPQYSRANRTRLPTIQARAGEAQDPRRTDVKINLRRQILRFM